MRRRAAFSQAVLALSCAAACGGSPATAPRESAIPPEHGGDAGQPSMFRDLVMTPAECTSPPVDRISRADARAAPAIVERIVRRGWAGFGTRVAGGVDFDALFATLVRWLDETLARSAS